MHYENHSVFHVRKIFQNCYLQYNSYGRSIKAKLPQRTVLSRTLYTLNVADFMPRTDTKIDLYADDMRYCALNIINGKL